MKKILVFGSDGMLGSTFVNMYENAYDITGVSHKTVDISDYKSLNGYILRQGNVDYILNCTAITDTTYCNTNEGMIRSYAVNVNGAYNLAVICSMNSIHLIHISTDYVHSQFSNQYHHEYPLNVYGTHKYIAELLLQQESRQHGLKCSIVRCSWLYGHTEKKANFIDKVIQQCKNNKREISVVDDSFGRPSSCEFVSRFVDCCIRCGSNGLVDGQNIMTPVSRFQFTISIISQMKKHLSLFDSIRVIPVKSSQFQSKINHTLSVPEKNTIPREFKRFVVENIEHYDDYEYWLEKYINENIVHIITKNKI